jgi:hypothetical protein
MTEYSNTTGLPSVTEVLSPWIDRQWYTAEACARGSAVHEALAEYLQGKPAFLCNPGNVKWAGYFYSGKKWIDQHVTKALVVEQRLVDERWRFCGQMDLVCKFKDIATADWLTLIDWKTGPPAVWHRLQIAGYRHLAKVDGQPTTRGMTIHLDADGGVPRVVEHPHNYEADLNSLLAAVGLWWVFNPQGKE